MADELAMKQSFLAEQHARLEKLLLRMAEFDSASNPRRAELLKKAFALSKEQDIKLQLDAIARLINQEKFKRAIDAQKEVRTDLQTLLELLLSENRSDRLKDEQARIRSYIREIDKIERMQRGVQGRNEGGVEPDQLADEQSRVADRTQSLADRIRENEGTPPGQAADDPSSAQRAEDAEPSPSDADKEPSPAEGQSEQPADPEAADESATPGESDATENSQSPGDSEPSAGAPADTPPAEGQPSDKPPEAGGANAPAAGQPGSSDPSQSPPPESFPGQKQIEEAQQRMRDAERKLQEAERNGALEDQREAARKLAEAKAKLEEILRQMREEEIERALAMLEVRLRKMLEMELQVYENTVRLAKRQADNTGRVLNVEAGKLSFQQRRVVLEADKCLALLREEGSSVAFPASIEQVREDMEQVSERLSEVKLGVITQGLQEDIIAALEEMLEALEQAQADQEQRRQSPLEMQAMPPGEQPLVDAIAELKMLKALQLRVNKRTNRYSKMLDDADDIVGQANDAELIDALRGLAERELHIYQITRDLSLGKNK